MVVGALIVIGWKVVEGVVAGAIVGIVGVVVGIVGAIVGSVGAIVGTVGAIVGSVGVVVLMLHSSTLTALLHTPNSPRNPFTGSNTSPTGQHCSIQINPGEQSQKHLWHCPSEAFDPVGTGDPKTLQVLFSWQIPAEGVVVGAVVGTVGAIVGVVGVVVGAVVEVVVGGEQSFVSVTQLAHSVLSMHCENK